MTCIANALDAREPLVLVSHNPISVFTTTHEHIGRIQRKPDGHYDREDLMTLVKEGHAAYYDADMVRALSRAIESLVHGCPPR